MARKPNRAALGARGAASTRGVWLWLSIGSAVLALIGSIVALVVPRVYAPLTPYFLPQALAQDVANLALVAPAWLILAALALRGSLRAYLLWLGVLMFSVYNYVIYAFSIPFGPVFPLWVAVLGISLYALIGGLLASDHDAVKTAYNNRRFVRVAGWMLIVTALLFGLLWASEDVPAIVNGRAPQSLADLGLPTNPVHVLDYAFFLPAIEVTGVWLLKGKAPAFTLAPSLMVFVILTGVPILLTPFLQTVRGEPAEWGVIAPIGTLTLLFLGMLLWLMNSIRDTRSGG